jgi:UDP-N-acetylglucosamine acyltransferase
MSIHPTALIHPAAVLADDVHIGPWVLIEAGVRIGKGCRIEAQAQILNEVTMGENCTVSAGACIGGNPQDLKFDRDTPSRVEIGSGNTFRENVTIHRGAEANSVTRVGDRNYFMVGAHVGHDCVIGSDNVLANDCLLGGFVLLGDSSFLGGGAAFHQFVRVGDLCMVKGLTAISRDVPPYMTAWGSNQLGGLNVIGMRRSGIRATARRSVKVAFNHMFRAGFNLTQALAGAAALELEPEARRFIDFFRTPSRKGICLR